MHIRCVVRDDMRALAREIIFQFLDSAFVAGNDRRGKHHSVRRLEADVFVRLVADTCERREFVALCARREDNEPLRGILRHVLDGDDRIILVFDEAELACDLDVGAHRSSVDDDRLAVLLGEMHDADEALQVRCEHRDDEPPVRFFDDLLQGRVHVPFGDRETRLPHVGGIHEEREDFAVLEDAEFAHFLFRRNTAVVVELDVAREDDISPCCLDDDSHGIRHGVRDPEETYCVVAETDDHIFLHFADLHRHSLREFLLALLYHLSGQFTRVDERVPDAIDDVRYAADMIKVSVRDEKPAYLVASLFEVAGVRQNVIDARGFVFLELESCVEDEDIVADLDRGHVAADLFDAAQGDDAYRVLRYGRDLYLWAHPLARGWCGVLNAHDAVATWRPIRAE